MYVANARKKKWALEFISEVEVSCDRSQGHEESEWADTVMHNLSNTVHAGLGDESSVSKVFALQA